MNLTLRIPQSVLCVARQDLARSHPFAYERIGFFRCRPTVRSDLIVITGYDAVPDEQYIENSGAGACIGRMAIQTAMQRILTHKVGQIHVHQHGHRGVPSPSSTDSANQPRLVSSFRNLGPQLPHGFIILSNTHAWGKFAVPGRRRFEKLRSISVVSARLEFL
jgi:hypothetical protein